VREQKRPKLPRGLHWDNKSPHIFFKWRDARGKQHGQGTNTDDPAKALIFKLQFLEEQRESQDQVEVREDLRKLPLKKVAEMYFGWKIANCAKSTIGRERRMFKNVSNFFGSDSLVKSIKLAKIRQYQQKRRADVSKTMKREVSGRTVNYEIQLLRGVMKYAGCWTPELEVQYEPLRQRKKRKGKVATKEDFMRIISEAKTNEYWELAMYCAAVAVGTGCRSCEIRNLQLQDIHIDEGKIVVKAEIAKNRTEREPRLMALGEWGLRNLVLRAQALGATAPHHYLLPLNVRKSRQLAKKTNDKWDVNQPMVSWVKSWRKLVEKCGMKGFRFHDLRHTFRTLGAEAGVPLEVMMAQLGHMDRETSLEYVHIQQRALERAKQLIEAEQTEILALAQKPSTSKAGELHGRLPPAVNQ
jgi:integrase